MLDRKNVTLAVRETGVSRHQGDPFEGPPETPRTSQHYRIEGIKGVPDLGTKGNGIQVFSVSSCLLSLPSSFFLFFSPVLHN